MEYKFDDEETLGKAVQSMKAFCKLMKNMDIPTEDYIVGDFARPNEYPGLAGKKWSRLCGFTFKSAENGQYFQFVYVPKLRGTLARNQMALSGWYCWTLFSSDKDNKQVTSINQMMRDFGFDINKFVHSDVFSKYVKAFKSNVSYALDNQVAELLSRPESEFKDYKELQRYVKAIRESIPKMEEVKQVVTPDNMYDDSGAPEYARGSAPKVGHAKIAYNADKTYDLRNTGKKAQQDELRKRAIDKIAQRMNATAKKDEPTVEQPKKREHGHGRVIADPSMKYKFGGGRPRKPDSEIFDKYDDYDNDDFR